MKTDTFDTDLKWIAENDIEFDVNSKNNIPTSWNEIVSEQNNIKRLEKESTSLKEQLYEYKNKNNHLQCDYTKLQKENQQLYEDIETMKNLVDDLKLWSKEKSNRIKELLFEQKGFIRKNRKYYDVLEEKLSLQTNLESKEVQCVKLENANKKLILENSQLAERVAKLENQVKEKTTTIDAMAHKLIDLKNKAKKATLYLCKYSVKRVYRFYSNQDAVLYVMKEREETGGSRTLTIDTGGKITDHMAETVLSVLNVPGSTSRFTISYKNGSSDTFETPLRDEVVNGVQYCLFTMDENIDLDDENVLILEQQRLSSPSSGKINMDQKK